jgi:hypothetical protein
MAENQYDVTTPLKQIEAGRVKTILQSQYKVRLKYRELIEFSPVDISKMCNSSKNITPEIIAKAAGREKEN